MFTLGLEKVAFFGSVFNKKPDSTSQKDSEVYQQHLNRELKDPFWMEKDPIHNAASLPEKHNREFRHSFDGFVDIMEDAVKTRGLSRKKAATEFKNFFQKWHKANDSNYQWKNLGTADRPNYGFLHKSEGTPYNVDFWSDAMIAMDKK